MEKKYLIIYTSGFEDTPDITFISSPDSMDKVLITAIENKGFNLQEEENDINELLNERPIGIAEILNTPEEHPDINWYYELPE